MKLAIIAAALAIGATTGYPATIVTLKDVTVYATDKTGKTYPYPAPDGTKVIIGSDSGEFPCVVETVQDDKTCSVVMPNNHPWTVKRVECLVWVGFVSNTVQAQNSQSMGARIAAALRRAFTRNE